MRSDDAGRVSQGSAPDYHPRQARVSESVDDGALKALAPRGVWVRVPPRARTLWVVVARRWASIGPAA
jgi:hypothetical protein